MTHAGHDALQFRRAGALLVVASADVEGVVPHPDVSAVPGAPDGVVGLFGWHGSVVPLVEPGVSATNAAAAAVIVMSVGGAMGLAADDVVGWVDRDDGARPVDPNQLYHRLRDAVRGSENAIRR